MPRWVIDGFAAAAAPVGVHIGRNAAAVVSYRARTVRVQGHSHPRRMPGKRLVDGIVHDFIDHVVQAGPVVRIADIHARAFANSIQPLEDLDGFRAIFQRGFDCHLGCFTHVISIFSRRLD